MSIDRHRQIHSELRESLDYWTQGSVLEFIASLQALLDTEEMRRKDLAEALGVSEATVSKALRPDGNLTVRMMNKLAAAVGASVHVHVDRREAIVKWVRVNDGVRADELSSASFQLSPAPSSTAGPEGRRKRAFDLDSSGPAPTTERLELRH